MFSLAVGGLVVAVLATVFRRGNSRAFAGGFVICSAAYLLLAFGPWFNTNIAPHLTTTKLFRYLYPKLQHSTSSLNTSLSSGLVELDGDGFEGYYIERRFRCELAFQCLPRPLLKYAGTAIMDR